jgi:hypothetical protein
VQRLAPHLIDHRFDHFRVAVTNVEDAEPAQTIDVFFAVDVAIGIRARIGPFDDRCCALRRGRFTVLEKARIDVIAKRFDRFARDPSCVIRRNRRFGYER